LKGLVLLLNRGFVELSEYLTDYMDERSRHHRASSGQLPGYRDPGWSRHVTESGEEMIQPYQMAKYTYGGGISGQDEEANYQYSA